MPNDSSVNMICPYYVGMDKTRIYCEGCITDYARQEGVYRFINQAIKEKHIKNYCSTYNYSSCGYAHYKDITYDEGKEAPQKALERPIKLVNNKVRRNNRKRKKNKRKSKYKATKNTNKNDNIEGQIDIYDWLGNGCIKQN